MRSTEVTSHPPRFMFVAKRWILAFSLSLGCVAGCGDGGGGANVEGVITLDGQPLPGVHLMFDRPELSPNENIGYIGKTDESGHYSLRPTIGDGSGVPPGKYRVSLTTAVSDPSQSAPTSTSPTSRMPFGSDTPPPLPEKIPPSYRGGKLRFEVPADGTDKANFDLKSK